jgi:scyllo-inositol 2-dehydrogenase (NADP+)
MESPAIVTGILSFGMSGTLFHAPFIYAHEGFKLKAVVERSTKKAHGFYPGIISYDSVEQLLEDPEVQLVIVNTPNNLHYAHAKAALLAGKHVLVEKPATITVQELDELYTLAQEQHLFYMVFQNRRWDSDFTAIKEVIDGGRLGKLAEVHLRYDRYRLLPGHKLFKEKNDTPGNGLTYDLGPHLVDQAISLFGQPVKSHKVTAVNRPGSEVADFFNYTLEFEQGLLVFITASLVVPHALPAFVLHGTHGSFIKNRSDVQETQLLQNMSPLHADYGKEEEANAGILTIVQPDGTTQTEKVAGGAGNYLGLFDAVYRQIVHAQPYPVTHEQVRWQIALLEKENDF